MQQVMGEAKAAWQDEEYADDVTMLIVRWPASEQPQVLPDVFPEGAAGLAEIASATPAA